MLVGTAPVNLFLSNRLMKETTLLLRIGLEGREMPRYLQNLETGDATKFSRDRTRQLIVVK
jgi:hypothetical protein